MAGVKESLAGQMEDIGIPRSIADPLASVGAGADFLIGSVAPAAPSDVVSVAQSIPKVPSMMQAARARREELQPASAPSADRVGPAAQRQPLFNEQGMVTGSENFKPVRVPDAVQNVPTSFLLIQKDHAKRERPLVLEKMQQALFLQTIIWENNQ